MEILICLFLFHKCNRQRGSQIYMDRLKHMPKIYASPLKVAAYLSHMIDKEWQDFIGGFLYASPIK